MPRGQPRVVPVPEALPAADHCVPCPPDTQRKRDIRAVVENNDFHSIIEEESGRSSSADYLDTYDDTPKETKELSEESNEEEFKEDKETFVETVKKPLEVDRKEITQPARTTPETITSSSPSAVIIDTIQPETVVGKVGTAVNGDEPAGHAAAVGQWNSTLPALVERLRSALEHTLAGGAEKQSVEEEVIQQRPTREDSGVDSEEDFRIRTSMERVLVGCTEPELRKDLKFLEDLLLSDIQTALSRLRETLERTDVAALARNGAASDSTGKLHLLRLVSSLLSRLQVPEVEEKKILQSEKTTTPVLPSTSLSRRRRGTRHTIGVSTEELARARKWLEEERNSGCLPLEDVRPAKERGQNGNNEETVNLEKRSEEIRDKCVKDAINQRQLLEDKNKEIRESYKGGQEVDDKQVESTCRYNNIYQESNVNIVEDNEVKGRVSRLAEILGQRAELAASRYPPANKFTAKKSKIKRANTIDIPSYLKLQTESLGRKSTGCVSLRRPINVGDKASVHRTGTIVPSFQPRTENDRKFLALINKNNDAPANTVVPFKAFGFAKTMDVPPSTAQKNWTSRFSNIKTTFDKPSGNEDRENRPSLKDRANKMFPGAVQNSSYPSNSDLGSNYNSPVMKDFGGGFRHAPSSPFKKIEKSPVSPSKVPPAYHWPKNAPVPTNNLREKARMMFDRENAPARSRPTADREKPAFPRPPWIDHERNGTVTENGRIDYKSFCKQFAPFVGKAAMETKKQREEQRIPGVVDGKISFKIPEGRKPPRIHQYPVERPLIKEKIGPEIRNSYETIKGNGGYGQKEPPKPRFADATLRGSSSVAVQTGINEDHQDEGRSFRVAPKIPKGSMVCSNVSVQTTDLERPCASISDTDTRKQWTPIVDEGSTIQRGVDHQRFVLDHNQSYRTVSGDSPMSSPRRSSSEQNNRDTVVTHQAGHQKQPGNPVNLPKDPTHEIQGYQKEDEEGPDQPVVSPTSLPTYDRSQKDKSTADWPVEDPAFLDDQNIQNQDISPDVGVVTRYTCAIATVATSVDSPEPRSEELPFIESRASSSPSPSRWSSRSRPTTSETATPEDEIRRHNLLQQSLVRRLQNEIACLNDEPPRHQPSAAHAQQRNFGESSGISQSPMSIQGSPQSIDQTSNINRPQQIPQSHQQSFDHPANFDQSPNAQPSKFGKFLTPIPQKKPEPSRTTHSPSPIPANRVVSLREAYELSPSGQPIQKERSPVPNGGASIDSSDEYLVSCANKSSRSIVLSKSESWHQLAQSAGYPRAPRVSVPTATVTSRPSVHPKPPKPRSPSSQKLRSKQFEASSMADSVKRMEDKIRQYFDSPVDATETRDHSKRRSPRTFNKEMVGLSRSRTMPGMSDERLRLQIPSTVQQTPLLNVNTADVDKVFDDLFEEATRTEGRHC
ncbi:hypothetical protein WN55_05624 [Dufourea novaeangliae]|uniref:Smoothelin domain-containing protein n=1 Tax=Dufourea novaeangliae TaxID=178035 RepID=A0A154PNL9_DUFNO|nr:hypothetical protein WN55_05624 [Dufourea novaeangliae]